MALRKNSPTKSTKLTTKTFVRTFEYKLIRFMARKYFRISEVTTICSVSEEFIATLEQENLITCVIRKQERFYPLDQVDRIRVAHNLIGDLGVNLEGVAVALHMREQIIAMRQQLLKLMNTSRQHRK